MFTLDVRGALRADGEFLAPARWTVAGGRTVSLETCANADARPIDAVLIPGLVNAHAHLDLAGSRPVRSEGRFTDWLLEVGNARASGRDVDAEAAAQASQLASRGVTAVGDIDASGGRALRARRDVPLDGVSYLEIVGVARESARARLAQALELVDRGGGGAGLSPHAPYSVHQDVLPEIARAAARRGLRLAMHLAETPDEARYLRHGDGPFEEFLAAIDRGRPFESPPGVGPLEYAERAGLLAAGCVVVHGNELEDDDVARLVSHECSVVYCHGTHRHFERGPHRIAELLDRGVNVALGTDSGMSNEGVDLFSEMCRLAADRPDIAPIALLRCATLGGRIALGLDGGATVFSPGSRADAILLGGAPGDVESMTTGDVAAWILSGSARLATTIHAGQVGAVADEAPASLRGFLDTVMERG
ncbi:MAG: amidohydrolase family protein [Planctomycetota bacterium]|jgi:cytosine/adenosine deaminase-related metal-dependent hydrolase